MIKKREKSVLKNLNFKNTLFSLFYNGLMEIYFTPDFIEPFFLYSIFRQIISKKLNIIIIDIKGEIYEYIYNLFYRTNYRWSIRYNLNVYITS